MMHREEGKGTLLFFVSLLLVQTSNLSLIDRHYYSFDASLFAETTLRSFDAAQQRLGEGGKERGREERGEK